MGNRKAKQFWLGASNISKITAMINSARKDKDNTYLKAQSFDQVLNFRRTKEQNLIALRKVLNNKNIFELYAYIINDMYKFEFNCISSVESKIQKTMYNASELDLLSQVNLLEHSFGVFNQMYLSDKKTYGQFADFFLLAALVHDFGKSPNLREAYGLSSEIAHHKNSALYLEYKIVDVKTNFTQAEKDTLYLVINAIRVHHDNLESIVSVPTDINKIQNEFKDNEFQNMILLFLKEADSKQRELELEKIRMMNH